MSFIKTMIKTRQPRRFGFQPRYYDADREDLQFRKEAIEREVREERALEASGESSLSQDAMRSKMRREWRRDDLRKMDGQATKRVALIAIILTLIAIVLLYR